MFVCIVWLTLIGSAIGGSKEATGSKEKCLKALQAVVQGSESCAERYFESINEQLRRYTTQLFTSQAQSVIDKFEQEFGVSITQSFYSAASTFGGCTDYVVNTPSLIPVDQNYPISFANTEAPAQSIESISVSVNLETSNVNNLQIFLSYFEPVSIENVISLYMPNQCDTQPGFLATFQDGGLDYLNYCAQLTNGLTFAASEGLSIQESLTQSGVQSNSPIYLVISALNFGPSSVAVQFNSATLRICTAQMTASALTRDVAKSNLNVPGFRYDAGVYYYTTVYRDEAGQMQYITISAAKSSIFCKK